MWKIPTSYCKHWPNELFNWVNPSTTTKRTTNRSGRREYAYIFSKTLQRGEHTTLQGKDIAICTPSGAWTSLLSSDGHDLYSTTHAACSLLPDLETIPALYNKGNVIRSHPTVALQQEETTVITIPLSQLVLILRGVPILSYPSLQRKPSHIRLVNSQLAHHFPTLGNIPLSLLNLFLLQELAQIFWDATSRHPTGASLPGHGTQTPLLLLGWHSFTLPLLLTPWLTVKCLTGARHWEELEYKASWPQTLSLRGPKSVGVNSLSPQSLKTPWGQRLCDAFAFVSL